MVNFKCAVTSCTETAGSDQLGKVFLVRGGMRKCLICEQLFSLGGAAEHATAICTRSIANKQGEEGANQDRHSASRFRP
jgi:hypothetical protein